MRNTLKKLKQAWLGSICLFISANAISQNWNPGHRIGTETGVYHYTQGQVPANMVEIHAAAIPNTGLTYDWESCETPAGNFASTGTTTSSFIFSNNVFTKTTYYRRKTTHTATGTSIYSNVIKLSLVPNNWEDMNYVREHEVLKNNVNTRVDVENGLLIGDKLQQTRYFDGLGRPVQAVSRETGAASSPGSQAKDIIQIWRYDAAGTEPLQYLPFADFNSDIYQSGKYRADAEPKQMGYYSAEYSETNPYFFRLYERSHLRRITKILTPGGKPGGITSNTPGNSFGYQLNEGNNFDLVKNFGIDYIQGNPPIDKGVYMQHTLYKLVYTDPKGKKIITYSDKAGRTLLKKVQLEDNPTTAHTGWICTYYVYDDMGLLRFEIQPEAVKYLEANNWSFAGTDGTKVLNELCFQYNYDAKGRVIWKKAPGASSIQMVYDLRDRLVFTQDGNQAAINQWTATLYDELDRPVINFLYNTTKTYTTLQNELNAASATTSAVTISAAANTGSGSITINTNYNTVPAADFNNAATITVLKYFFYDHYSFSGVKTFNTGYTNLNAYSTGDANVMPIATTNRVTNMLTGTKTRVLGSTVFLAATLYYDERGSAIQVLEDNIKSGVDITTTQYHFDGRVLSTCTDHTTSGTGYTNFKTLTKNVHDKIGRITAIQKQYASNTFKTIGEYQYDDFGRLKKKRLDPAYTAGGNAGLESLEYSFNIQGNLTGINKDYALKTAGSYNKWGHFFGQYLGYDNKDNVFSKSELNGQVTGVLWSTQGDDAQRMYTFTYDNANRLVAAAFTEQLHPGAGYSNAKMDFSVGGIGGSGQITYDYNGNLLSLQHKGVAAGAATPIVVDDLRYTYSLSNKLDKVKDETTATDQNGKLGDFKDGSNSTGNDYVYDNNGNVIVDLNKNVQSANGGAAGTKGVLYNYLDKPELIRITGKGTVRIVYSADGNVLQKAFIPESGSTTITTTINEFVYQETSTTLTASTAVPFSGTGLALTSMLFEEGRIRVITPTSTGNGLDALMVSGNLTLPNSKQGVYDYYVRDYQENVRMILTEETHTAYNTATMETDRAAAETPVFGQSGAANEVSSTRYAKPTGWSNNSSAQVSRLGNLAGKTIGPNTLQKVMAGDKVSAQVSYYFAGTPGGNNSNMLNNVLGSLIASISGSGSTSGIVKSGTVGINTQLTNTPGFPDVINPAGNTSAPQAYLTILFFDERFNFISAAEGGAAQAQVASSWSSSTTPLVLPAVKAPKNGYVYVYVSNRSDQHVYFDDFKVSLQAGNIIEENHYYAYGLKIAAISSKKLGNGVEGVLKNEYLYQGAFAEFDDEVGWNSFALRDYDAQIGRWAQQDPFQQYASPYTGMGNDPVNNTDPSGGVVLPVIQFIPVASAAGSLAGGTAAALSTVSTVSSITSLTFTTINAVNAVINTDITTVGVGTDPVKLAAIRAQGMGDAGVNATTLGLWDLFGNNHESKYTDPEEKRAYLEGRLMGDAAILGTTVARITAALATAAAGSETVVVGVAGVFVAAHAGFSAQAAVNDVVISLRKLYQLNMSSNAMGDAGKTAGDTGKGGTNIFGKEVEKITTRMGRDGKAAEVKFKDGSVIDISETRVKEWMPNTHPNAPEGTLQKIKFEEFLPGSKGYKRTPTQEEIDFLNSLFK